MNSLLEESLKLPVSERIRLVEEIWDSIAATPDAVELSPEQIAELERRIEDYQQHPESTVPWEEVRTRLRRIA